MALTDADIDWIIAVELNRGPSHWDHWTVSRNGNWVRSYCGKLVTIFERPKGSGCWAYSVKGRLKKDGVRFSARSYPTQEDARDAAMEELKGGGR